ncbi:MAG TPA: bifunctional oligoribonuclease/PAP phosphatase NrnA [Candidatus Limnocylindrales bacterium]|nr:bifunctional oligoribonuclease/PAP phosphatase NrnA [Candidatus Limnocylindrales bacterium]
MINSYQILKEIKQIVDKSKSFLITGQYNPDGDSIGAELALYKILSVAKSGQNGILDPEVVIDVVNEELPPHRYHFLPNFQAVKSLEEVQGRRYEVGFIVDGGRDRTGEVLPLLEKCDYTINIDHHKSRLTSTDTISWIEPYVSSTCELVFEFIDHPDWQVPLTPDIATCIYAGMIYDTGSFQFSSTSPRTHRIAARLLEAGISAWKISEEVLLSKSYAALKLLTAVLSEVRRDPRGSILWSVITQKMLKETGATPQDEEGIINQYNFVEGCEAAVLFKELDKNKIKVSLRSRGKVDMGAIAKTLNPGGGGHERAAGCTLEGPMEEVQKRVLKAVEKALYGS